MRRDAAKQPNAQEVSSQSSYLGSRLPKRIYSNVLGSFLEGETDRTLTGKHINFIIIQFILPSKQMLFSSVED